MKDTIDNNVTGWIFNGDSLVEQGLNLIKRFSEVLDLHGSDEYNHVSHNAAKQRFTWSAVANEYLQKLYN
ncbi:glycogen synthase [Shewanella aestuarii]|uniref:Glycogen synthase n=1 Tax=Shewanella aestuarii TaxID=1028752 RepID=A0A6G9QJB3_9GAMM|nr:glycogen synthase [Shewanella aestuarii]QIR14640.1 glycogen synthase [Shewanella aestuarii]